VFILSYSISISCAERKPGQKTNMVYTPGRKRDMIYTFTRKEVEVLHPLLESYYNTVRHGSKTVECSAALIALVDLACDMKGVCPNQQGKQMKYQLLSCHQIEKGLASPKGSKLYENEAPRVSCLKKRKKSE